MAALLATGPFDVPPKISVAALAVGGCLGLYELVWIRMVAAARLPSRGGPTVLFVVLSLAVVAVAVIAAPEPTPRAGRADR